MLRLASVCLLAVLTLGAAPAHTQVHDEIAYQGALATPDGRPLSPTLARRPYSPNNGSGFRRQVAGATGARAPLTLPELLAPADGASDLEIPVELSWRVVPSAEGYDVQLAASADFSEPLVDTTGVRAATLVVHDLAPNTTYFWRVQAFGEEASSGFTPAFRFATVQTTAAEEGDAPRQFLLAGNYPNPFNPTTVIPYTLPEASAVRIELYDLSGRRVRVLVDARQPAGRHAVRLDATGLAGGTYLYRIRAGRFTAQRTMVLMR